MRKRILSLILSLVILGSVCLSVSAHEVPDFDRPGSISIVMTHNDKPIAGGSLTIYRVADVVSQNGDMQFAYTTDFAGCSIAVTELNSAQLPEELARIAVARNVPCTTRKLDAQGKVRFEDLKIGLYLVVQQEAAPGYTKVNPFLVSVPQNEGGSYVYDVDAAPKNIPEPEVIPTEPTKPDDNLPQTGQINWPVPMMAVTGILLLVAGCCLWLSGKREQDEV